MARRGLGLFAEKCLPIAIASQARQRSSLSALGCGSNYFSRVEMLRHIALRISIEGPCVVPRVVEGGINAC
jgi:hypothetical protein